MSQNITQAILKELYPLVDSSFKTNKSRWKKVMSDFFQARSASLYDIAPMDRIFFNADDEAALFEAMKITKAQVSEILHKVYYYDEIKNEYASLVKDEHAILSLTILRYFIIKNDKQNTDISSLYLAFTGKIYASAHYRSFPIAPTEYRHVMEYAINNMSNKYDIVKYGSVIGAVRSQCSTWIDTYKSRFKDYDDEDVSYLIQQLKSRISKFIINIAKEYYDAFENKEYITYDSDNVSSDEFHLADSDSLKLERTIEISINRLESSTTDFKLCKMCADNNVRTDELKSIIDSIMSNPENFELCKELIRNICTYYFINGKTKDVRNVDFLAFSCSPKPNSKDELYLREKEIIEELLIKNSTKYEARSKRAATKISYNTAILKYFVFLIHEANK